MLPDSTLTNESDDSSDCGENESVNSDKKQNNDSCQLLRQKNRKRQHTREESTSSIMVKKKRQPDAVEDSTSSDGGEETNQSPALAACTCQHVKKSVDVNKLRKLLKATGLALDCLQCMKGGDKKSATPVTTTSAVVNNDTENYNALGDEEGGFEYDTTLWLCLKCGTQLCGRARNQHALNHFRTPHSDCHALTMNTSSFEIWCYECNNEVRANSRKNLLECVELVKKISEKSWSGSGNSMLNVDNNVVASWEAMWTPAADKEDNTNTSIKNKPIELPAPPPIPGMAKRVSEKTESLTLLSSINSGISSILQQPKVSNTLNLDNLPRVRGLTNLGNTCFFNAVLQCLAQTPYLLDVLKESAEPGEEFILPGGTFKFKNDENVELPMIKGTLSGWGGLTATLAQTLEELQSGGGVINPSRLFDKLCLKCPQFRGGDQHDSHELLRHLLESVRSEDLKRYQRVILQNLGFKDQDNVSEEMRQKCKIYGNQAADRILRPEQVFRGFLVSTLTCQECFNVSSRHENFLDVSLPVSVEKPQPILRKVSPEPSPIESFYLKPTATAASAPSLASVPASSSASASTKTPSQLKKEKENERKAKRAAKHQKKKLAQKLALESVVGTDERPAAATPSNWTFFNVSSSSEESDADVEDNLADDNEKEAKMPTKIDVSATCPAPACADPNGNSAELHSPVSLEKRDDSPENMDKDSLDEDENDSGIATSPANPGSNFLPSSETNGGSNEDSGAPPAHNSSMVTIGLSEKGVNLVRQLSQGDSNNTKSKLVPTLNPNQTQSKKQNHKQKSSQDQKTIGGMPLRNGEELAGQIGDLQLSEMKTISTRAKRVRTQSHSDWSTTMAPRYHCDECECSVQSCLNSFTAVELMSGNNKVGCDNCTKNINGSQPKAKTVYTDATKQFLISSPPAVLILHLKRFQLGPRCIFRKLTRHVDYPMILDIAPFCGSKVKNLPNIDRKQKKLLYALYGVVEHAGGMYGGHYTAYVKVRPKLAADDKRWKFIPQGSKAELDQDDEQRKKLDELLAKEKAREMRLKAANDSDDFTSASCSSSTASSANSSDHDETPRALDDDIAASGSGLGAVGGDEMAKDVLVPQGKWYYVSDSHVQEVSADSVLRAQAYLLFYERIY